MSKMSPEKSLYLETMVFGASQISPHRSWSSCCCCCCCWQPSENVLLRNYIASSTFALRVGKQGRAKNGKLLQSCWKEAHHTCFWGPQLFPLTSVAERNPEQLKKNVWFCSSFFSTVKKVLRPMGISFFVEIPHSSPKLRAPDWAQEIISFEKEFLGGRKSEMNLRDSPSLFSSVCFCRIESRSLEKIEIAGFFATQGGKGKKMRNWTRIWINLITLLNNNEHLRAFMLFDAIIAFICLTEIQPKSMWERVSSALKNFSQRSPLYFSYELLSFPIPYRAFTGVFSALV